nr:type II toxin-antitoxin system VapC family toxin [Candidatus Freyrarchaeum guaymaensis]
MEVGSTVILDTDVLIDVLRDGTIVRLVELFDAGITQITLYEYLRGEVFMRGNVQDQKKLLEEILAVYHLNNASILKASEIWAALRKEGRLLSSRDVFNAAIAITRKVPFTTRNVKHYQRFEKFGLQLVPWHELQKQLRKSK